MRLLIFKVEDDKTELLKIVHSNNYYVDTQFNCLEVPNICTYSRVDNTLRDYLMLNISHNLTIMVDEYSRIIKWEENKS